MFRYFIITITQLYTYAIFAYVLMSWIPIKRGIIEDINNVLASICDPFLEPFRRFIPPIGGVVDISPIIALLVLQFGVQLILRFI